MLDLNKYLNELSNNIKNEKVLSDLKSIQNEIINELNDSKIIIFGNGGSASIADHFAVDMTKNAGYKTLSLNNAPLITCLANDFGYDQWVSKCIDYYASENDIAIFISSSGKSENMINGCNNAKNKGLKTITLTGFDQNNPLSTLGDYNLWVNSNSYNIVENLHQIWLLSLVDLLIGKSEYPAN
tara:strand:+ start:1063 stop:1614 length:552 start_codon:yes stop_codon:yes gene_type:complete